MQHRVWDVLHKEDFLFLMVRLVVSIRFVVIKVVVLAVAMALLAQFSLQQVRAADVSVSCSEHGCNQATVALLFPGVSWYPGYSVQRTVSVTNTGASALTFHGQAVNTTATKQLPEVLDFLVRHGSTTVWHGSLADFWRQAGVSFGTLKPGASTTYTFKLAMDKAAGNEYQQASALFDLGLSVSVATSATTASSISSPHPASITTHTTKSKATTGASGTTSTPLLSLLTHDPHAGKTLGASITKMIGATGHPTSSASEFAYFSPSLFIIAIGIITVGIIFWIIKRKWKREFYRSVS